MYRAVPFAGHNSVHTGEVIGGNAISYIADGADIAKMKNPLIRDIACGTFFPPSCVESRSLRKLIILGGVAIQVDSSSLSELVILWVE